VTKKEKILAHELETAVAIKLIGLLVTYVLRLGKDCLTLGESVGGIGCARKTGRVNKSLTGSKSGSSNSEQGGNSNGKLHFTRSRERFGREMSKRCFLRRWAKPRS
jgi:hypothetical protein